MKLAFKIGGVAILIVIAALTVTKILRSQNAEWEARVAAVSTLADQLRDRSEELVEAADSLTDEAAGHKARADAGTVTIDSLRDALGSTPVPEGCEVVAADRDRIIRFQEVRYGELSNAHKLQLSAYTQLRKAELLAVTRGDSLQSVIDDRPRPRPGWIPEVAFGPFVGVCTTGRQCVGVGIQLSWDVEIF